MRSAYKGSSGFGGLFPLLYIKNNNIINIFYLISVEILWFYAVILNHPDIYVIHPIFLFFMLFPPQKSDHFSFLLLLVIWPLFQSDDYLLPLFLWSFILNITILNFVFRHVIFLLFQYFDLILDLVHQLIPVIQTSTISQEAKPYLQSFCYVLQSNFVAVKPLTLNFKGKIWILIIIICICLSKLIFIKFLADNSVQFIQYFAILSLVYLQHLLIIHLSP